MKKIRSKVWKILIAVAMIIQLSPSSFIIAKTNTLDSAYINVVSEKSAQVIDDGQNLNKYPNAAKLHVEVRVMGAVKEEKILIYNGNNNPGKTTVTGKEGYHIVQMSLDNEEFLSNSPVILNEGMNQKKDKKLIVDVAEDAFLTVKYQDEKGNTIAQSDVLKGDLKGTLEVDLKEINGYTPLLNEKQKILLEHKENELVLTYTINTDHKDDSNQGEELNAIQNIDAELFITNRSLKYNDSHFISIKESDLNSIGVDIDDLAPKAFNDSAIDLVFWQARVLPYGQYQTSSNGVNRVNDGKGITKLRYLHNHIEYLTEDDQWTVFKNDDQLVFYYLQTTNLADQVTINVSDWWNNGSTAYTRKIRYSVYNAVTSQPIGDSKITSYNSGHSGVSGIYLTPDKLASYEISYVTKGVEGNDSEIKNWQKGFSVTWTAPKQTVDIKIYVTPKKDDVTVEYINDDTKSVLLVSGYAAKYGFNFKGYVINRKLVKDTIEEIYGAIIKIETDLSKIEVLESISEAYTYIGAATSPDNKKLSLYYREKSANIQYKLNNRNGGKLSNTSETVKMNNGNPKGSVLTLHEDYEFVNWTDEQGNEVSTELTWIPKKENNLYRSHTYTANVRLIDKYTISTNVHNGTISESKTLKRGGNYHVTYRPNDGYVLSSIRVDGKDVSLEDYKDGYIFENITESHDINVQYVRDTRGFKASGVTTVYDGNTHHIAVSADLLNDEHWEFKESDMENGWSNQVPSGINVINKTYDARVVNDGGEVVYIQRGIKLKITKRPVNITIQSETGIPYDGNEHSLSYTIENLSDTAGVLKNHKAVITLRNNLQKDVGNYTVSVDAFHVFDQNTDVTANYEYQANQGTLEIIINTTALTIASQAYGYVNKYDGRNHDAVIGADALLNGKIITDKELPGLKVQYRYANGDWLNTMPQVNAVTRGLHIYVRAIATGYVSAEKEVDAIITPRMIDIEVSKESFEYDGQEHKLTGNGYMISGDGLAENQNALITLSGNAITEVGSHVVDVASYKIVDQNDDVSSNYEITSTSGKLTVTKNTKDLVITAKAYHDIYDGKYHDAITEIELKLHDQVVSDLSTYTIEYQYDDNEWTTKKPNMKEAGTKAVKIRASSTNYISQELSLEAVVLKRNMSVSLHTEYIPYDGKQHSLTTPEYTADNLLEDHKVSFDFNGNSAKEVGTHIVSIQQETFKIIDENNNEVQHNYVVNLLPGAIIIETNKKALTLSASAYVGIYDGKEHNAVENIQVQLNGDTVKLSDVTIEYYVDEEWTKVMPTIIKAQRKIIKIRASKEGYESEEITLYPTVAKRPVVLTIKQESFAYDGLAHSLTEPAYQLINGDKLVEGDKITLTLSGNERTELGTNEVTCETIDITNGKDSVMDNYAVEINKGSITIHENTDDLIVHADAYKGIYDGKSHDAAVNVDALLKGEDATHLDGFKMQYNTGDGWGDVMPMVQYVSDSKEIAVRAVAHGYISNVLTLHTKITKRELTIQIRDETFTYDGLEHSLSQPGYDIVSSLGLGNGDELNLILSDNVIKNVGSHAVNVSKYEIHDDDKNSMLDNYNVNIYSGKLTIDTNTTALRVEAQGYQGIYDGKNHNAVINLKAYFNQSPIENIKGFKYQYNVDDHWVDEMPVIKEAQEKELQVRAVADGYESAPVRVKAHIEKRKLYVEIFKEVFEYDGQEHSLSTPGYEIRNSSLAAYQELTLQLTGNARSELGKNSVSAKHVDINENHVSVIKNYEVTVYDGSIEIINNKNDLQISSSTAGYQGVYDGQDHKAVTNLNVLVKGNEVKELKDLHISYSMDDGKSWSEQMPYVNTYVKNLSIRIKVEAYGYTSVEKAIKANVTKRPLIINIDKKTFIYDGASHSVSYTMEEADIHSGLVKGQNALVTLVNAKRTLVGKNEVTGSVRIMKNEDETTSNYSITVHNGNINVQGEVIYNGNTETSGNVPLDAKKYNYGDYISIAETSDTLKKDNAVFMGWSLTKNEVLETADEIENAGIINETKMGERSITLYAVWAKDVKGGKDGHDGIADAYQTVFTYRSAGHGSISGTTLETVTFKKDGKYVKPYPVSPKANITIEAETHYAFDYWSDGSYQDMSEDMSELKMNTYDSDHVFTAYFDMDHHGTDPKNPDKSDNVPDKYQVKVSYEAVNGTVSIAYTYVTLYDEKGNFAQSGKGQLSNRQIPAAMAKKGFEQNSLVWRPEPKEGYVIEKDMTFVASFDRAAYGLEIHYVDESGHEITKPYMANILYQDQYNVKSPFVDGYVLLDGNQANIFGMMDSDAKVINVVYTEDKHGTDPENPDKGDEIPDKYQVKISYEAVNGTVSIAYTYVTLYDDEGNLTQTGKGQLHDEQIPTATAASGYDQNSERWINGKPSVQTIITQNVIYKVVFNEIVGPIVPITPNTPAPANKAPVTSDAITPSLNVNPSAPDLENAVDITNQETPKMKGENEIVKANKTPKAAGDANWALINFIASLMTVILAVFLLISKRKRKEDGDEGNTKAYDYDEETMKQENRSMLTRAIALILAIISVVVFLLTEDITLTMIFVDKWTLLMVVIALVQIVIVITGIKWKEDNKHNNRQTS